MTRACPTALLACVLGAATAHTVAHEGVELSIALRHPPGALEWLAARVADVSDPSSPRYGAWLSSDELAGLLAASDDDVEAALAWVAAECGEIARWERAAQDDWLRVAPRDAACSARLARDGRARLARADASVEERAAAAAVVGVVANRPRRFLSRGSGAARGAEAMREEDEAEGDDMPAVGAPNAQKAAIGLPLNESGAGVPGNLQLVWGPGTFGYLPSDLATFDASFDVPSAAPFVSVYGYNGTPGGDNFGEGTLDTTYITSMGSGVETIVANTNDTASTEETTGFGYALLEVMRAPCPK